VEKKATPLPTMVDDPFALLQQVVKEGYSLPPFAPSSIENNTVVMQILEAARISVNTHSTVLWEDFLEIIK
jgi:hypothetical protein